MGIEKLNPKASPGAVRRVGIQAAQEAADKAVSPLDYSPLSASGLSAEQMAARRTAYEAAYAPYEAEARRRDAEETKGGVWDLTRFPLR